MPYRFALIQHTPGNTLGAHMDAVLTQFDIRADYLPAWQVFQGDSWQALCHQYDGWVFLGGEMNVDDEAAYPYLATEKQAIRHLLAQHTPMLGICLGGQLMARASGAAVTRMPRTEVGWQPLTLTDAGRKDPVMSGLAEDYAPFQWHNDTFALPDGADNLASTLGCTHQAYWLGSRALAVQFHPEVSRQQIATWLAQSNSLTPEQKTQLAQQTEQRFDHQAAKTQAWFTGFLNQVLNFDACPHD